MISGYPNLTRLSEIFIQKYESYLPTAFDESMSILQKLNKIIQFMNETGILVNSAVDLIEASIASQNIDIVAMQQEIVDYKLNIDGQQSDFEALITDSLLPTSLESLMSTWFNNGKLEEIINLSILSGSPKGTYATLSAIQTAFPTGNKNIYLTTDNGHWNYWNGSVWVSGGVYQATGIANSSISYDKTDYLGIGKNLFDKSKRMIGFVVSNTNGVTSSDLGTSYDTSDYIPVIAGVTYTINKARKIALYNTAKVYVSGVDNTAYGLITFTPTVNGFLRFYVGQSFVDTTQVEVGSSVTTFERFAITSNLLRVDNKNIGIKSVGNDNLQDETITYTKVNPLGRIPIKKVGKNLLNLGVVTPSFYVNQATGNLSANASLSASDFIEVVEGSTYTLSIQHPTLNYSIPQLAYYNENKVFISGLTNSGVTNAVTLVPPVNAKYIRLTVENVSQQYYQFELGVKTTLETYQIKLQISELEKGKITNDYIANGTLSDEKVNPTSNITLKKVGKNLYNVATVTNGVYANFGTGTLTNNVDSSASDYIPVKPNTNYTHSNISNPVEQLAWYDINKVYISGITNSGVRDSIILLSPINAYFVRITGGKTINSTIQFQEGSTLTAFEEYRLSVRANEIQKRNFDTTYFTDEALVKLGLQDNKTIITVKKDGTGDYTTFRAAIENALNATKTNKYDIQIHEGVYDMLEEYTPAELNATSFIGYKKQPFVSWTGIGDKHKIFVKNEFPSDELIYDSATKLRVATIATLGEGSLNNFSATAMNNRYVVHDDYNYFRTKRDVNDCVFIKRKGVGSVMGGKQAWGEGSWSGMQSVFNNTVFITEFDYYAYTSHNNVNFDEPTLHKFNGCKFVTTLGDAVRFESLNSGQVDVVEMNGCHLNGAIVLSPHADYTTKNDYVLKGFGNEIVPVRFRNTDGVQHSYEFIGETQSVYNGTANTILKGTPISLNSNGLLMSPVTNDILYYGVVTQDTLAGKMGIVRLHGYLAIADTPLTGLVVGDKIGVVGGVLAKVTTGEYIGVVTMTDFIKLK